MNKHRTTYTDWKRSQARRMRLANSLARVLINTGMPLRECLKVINMVHMALEDKYMDKLLNSKAEQ